MKSTCQKAATQRSTRSKKGSDKSPTSSSSRRSATSTSKKFRFVVAVEEVVESTTAIESDRQLTWEELKKEAERRRVKGKLSFRAVKDVTMWCEEAYKGKKKLERV